MPKTQHGQAWLLVTRIVAQIELSFLTAPALTRYYSFHPWLPLPVPDCARVKASTETSALPWPLTMMHPCISGKQLGTLSSRTLNGVLLGRNLRFFPVRLRSEPNLSAFVSVSSGRLFSHFVHDDPKLLVSSHVPACDRRRCDRLHHTAKEAPHQIALRILHCMIGLLTSSPGTGGPLRLAVRGKLGRRRGKINLAVYNLYTQVG